MTKPTIIEAGICPHSPKLQMVSIMPIPSINPIHIKNIVSINFLSIGLWWAFRDLNPRPSGLVLEVRFELTLSVPLFF